MNVALRKNPTPIPLTPLRSSICNTPGSHCPSASPTEALPVAALEVFPGNECVGGRARCELLAQALRGVYCTKLLKHEGSSAQEEACLVAVDIPLVATAAFIP